MIHLFNFYISDLDYLSKIMKLGILILAGGQSSRMNYKDKASLKINDQTFLEHLATTFQNYPFSYISINQNQHYHIEGYKTIVDEYQEIGPISGIVSCFHQSDVDALFVVSCDMPLVKKEALELLLEHLKDHEGIFFEDQHHTYPTLGIYSRKLLPYLEESIHNQQYGLYRSIKKGDIQFLSIDATTLDPKILSNINTIEDYQKILEKY